MLYRLKAWPKAAEEFLKEWDNHEIQLFTFQTSGTTGPSKCITLSRRQIIAAASCSESQLGWQEGQRIGMALNAAGIGGKMSIVRSRYYNIEIIPLELRLNDDYKSSGSFASEAWTEYLDHLSLVPVQALTLLRYWAKHKVDPSTRLGTLLLGGGPLPADLEQFLRKDWPWNELRSQTTFRIFQGLGMTETAGHFALRNLFPVFETAYTVLPGIDCRLAPVHDESPTDKDESPTDRGELIITGPVTNHQPLTTREIVRMGPQPSQIEWLGRADLVIQSGGHTLLIDEIEEHMRAALHEASGLLSLGSWNFMAQTNWYLAPLADPIWGERVALCIPIETYEILAKSSELASLKPADWSPFLPPSSWPRAIAPVPQNCFDQAGKIIRLSPPLPNLAEPFTLG